MKATLKSLRTLVEHVWRNIDRKLSCDDERYAAKVASILARVKLKVAPGIRYPPPAD
jgi:hypothetical protein